ncbi:MAG: hypothetical protein FD123_2318 [Bacteroidetes bacterium]|nr:MAG: hypothetical protein FD123_2318 [Bacteroidota bacterium]
MALLLIRPASFGFNAETALTNTFQKKPAAVDSAIAAQQEFDAFAEKLGKAGIDLLIVEDTAEPVKPDAVFPNNWISLHDGKTIVLWPMQAASRRIERRNDIVEMLAARGYTELVDYSHHEKQNRFLEGTGSMVIDYPNRIAYAALSPRTDGGLLRTACRRLDYKPVAFRTIPVNGVSVYHTNVLMALHEKLAVICEDVIDPRDSGMVKRMLEETGHKLLPVTLEQMHAFAGNMLFTKNRNGEDICIMSAQAYASLDGAQKETISRFAAIVYGDIRCIETAGGGSARCMLAELR